MLPKKLADKEFEYSKYISEDILKKYGLVCEMARLMLEAIEHLEFGPALKKLMSKGICNYTVGPLTRLRVWTTIPSPISAAGRT